MLAFRAFLRGIVDYAGLFPPAGLDMPAAAGAYAGYRGGPTAWMLGRFVVPASRLDEFAAVFADLAPRTDDRGRWHLAVIGSGDVSNDFAAIRSFNRRHEAEPGPGPLVDSYECRSPGPEDAAPLAGIAAPDVHVACEVPTAWRHSRESGNPVSGASQGPELTSLLDAIRSAGAIAKLRTGGITPDSIPSAERVAEFIWQCARVGVPMKATAGLHHPVRSMQRLTYAPDSPVAMVHGFLNVFVAATLASALRATLTDAEGVATLVSVLEEEDPASFAFDDGRLGWRGHQLPVAVIAAARSGVALSFGSCSFDEPVSDLRRLGFEV